MSEKKAKKSKRIYYSMGEVAEMFDVNQSLIRYWESQFDILQPTKNRKGNRLFTPSDIEDLRLVYYLVKEKGMTLKGAQKRIRDNREGINHDIEIVDRLQTIRALLVEVREELKIGDDEIRVGLEGVTPEIAENDLVEAKSEDEVAFDDEFDAKAAETNLLGDEDIGLEQEGECGEQSDRRAAVKSGETGGGDISFELILDEDDKLLDESKVLESDSSKIDSVESSASGSEIAQSEPLEGGSLAQKKSEEKSGKTLQMDFFADLPLEEPAEMLISEGIADDKEYMNELHTKLMNGDDSAEISQIVAGFDEEEELSDRDKALIFEQTLF